MRLALIALVAAFPMLAACQTAGEMDDTYCKSLGATPGSSAYINCRLVRDQQRSNAAMTGLAIMNASRPQPVPMPRTCTSTPMGRSVHTTCY